MRRKIDQSKDSIGKRAIFADKVKNLPTCPG
jgi:hypothetical protein